MNASVKRLLAFGRCKFALSRVSKYKTLIMTVLLYGAEAWTLSAVDERGLGAFEWQIVRKIYGS